MALTTEQVKILYDKKFLEQLESFLIIGAMDGIKHDDVLNHLPRKGNSIKIFVEPVKFHLESLKKNIKDIDHVFLEQEIISDTREEVSLVYVDQKYLDLYATWMDGCSSVIEEGKPINIPIREVKSEHLCTLKKECKTVYDILEKHNLKKIDYIQIDTEGYDQKIVESIDLVLLDVKILKFEVFYLRHGFSEKIREKLDFLGYDFVNVGEAGENLFCIRRDFLTFLNQKSS